MTKNDTPTLGYDQAEHVPELKSDKPDRRDPKDVLIEYLKEMLLFKSYALNRLQRETQVLLLRNVQIFNAGTFDGAFQIRNVMYGVKVMWKPTQA